MAIKEAIPIVGCGRASNTTNITVVVTISFWNFFFFTESLNTLEDTDLDALMADLVADICEVEKTAFQGQKEVSCDSRDQPAAVTQFPANIAAYGHQSSPTNFAVTHTVDNLTPPPPPAEVDFDLLPPPPPPPTPPLEPLTQVSRQKNLISNLKNLIFQ